jgi:hypothetical protein
LSAGRAIAAFVNCRSRLVSVPGRAGIAAVALDVARPRSSTLPAPVAATVTVPAKLLFALARATSLAAAVTVKAARAADDERAGLGDVSPAVTEKVPVPTVEAPRTMALVSVTETALLPELRRLTGPPKLLAPSLRPMVLAPALKLDDR